MLKVIIMKNTRALNQDDFNSMYHLGSLKRQKKINRINFIHDAVNSFFGDIIARLEISKIARLHIDKISFSINPYGKPFLLNNPNIHYNISHSGSYVTCVFSDEEVGIDIEEVKEVNLNISKRFFTIDEYNYVMEKDSKHRFYEVWTKKESRIKYEGLGLYMPLNSFSIFDTNGSFHYHNIFLDEKTVCHVCSGKQEPPLLKMMSIEELVEEIKLSFDFDNLDKRFELTEKQIQQLNQKK